MNPLVSIIIPTFNRAYLIAETLDSVLAQTYQNWECIIVDDGSSDHTDEVVGKYVQKDNRFKYYHRPEEHLPGGNGARNFGFKMSKGEYIQWFDSDDLMLPEKLELKVKAMVENEVDFVVCQNREIISFNPYKVKKRWDINKEGDILLNHIKGNIAFTTAGPMFKKKYLNKVKCLFDENVKIGQEWEFFSRLLAKSPNLILVDKSLYHFRNQSDGIRSEIDIFKYLNRCQTEYNLFNYINYSRYFKKNTKQHYEYQQFKLYLSMRRFRYLRKNISFMKGLRCFLQNLWLIDFTYLVKNTIKAFKSPVFFRKIINKS